MSYIFQNSISILFLFRWAYFWIFDCWRILCARHGRCSWADRHDWNCADPICSSSRTNRQPISNCRGCRSHSPMKSMDDESLKYTISKNTINYHPEEAYFYIVLLCCLPNLAKVCQSLQHDKWIEKFYCKLVAGYEEEPLYVVLPPF